MDRVRLGPQHCVYMRCTGLRTALKPQLLNNISPGIQKVPTVYTSTYYSCGTDTRGKENAGGIA